MSDGNQKPRPSGRGVVTKRNVENPTLPSGATGVHRADDGKRWEAYVLDDDDLRLLGVYTTKRAAIAARADYWATLKRNVTQ